MFEGAKCSFVELISQYKIEIPMIQRDYAQGRNVGKAPVIRKIFLDDLYDKLQNWDIQNKQLIPMELHFVYGNTVGRKFIPLDGQQRLTTLFLLHWYLALKEGKLDEKIHFNGGESTVREALLNLCYLTRKSSEKFIRSLVENATVDLLQQELVTNLAYDSKASRKFIAQGMVCNIINKGWFFQYWENDPTVISMLIMIEAIHEKFQSTDEFFAKLVSDNPPITFRLLDIDQKNEDIFYIRMNSRGKALTDFENFKAELLGCMQDSVQKEELVERIEGNWAEFFWQYRNSDYLYDDQILNTLRAFFTYAVALSEDDKREELLEKFLNTSYLPFENYRSLDLLTKEKLHDIFEKVNILCRYNHSLRKISDENLEFILGKDDSSDESSPSLMERMMNSYNVEGYRDKQLTYPERVRLYAYLCFFERMDGVLDVDALKSWLRVTTHFIRYSQIDNIERFSAALRGIREMIPGRLDIYTWLATNPKVSFFRKEIYEEECLKAWLRQQSVMDWSAMITELENHPYLDGQILFLLEYADITKEQVALWTDLDQRKAYMRLSDYYNRFRICFNEDGCIYAVEEYDYLWQRALLTIGDYTLPYKSNYSFLANGKGSLFRSDITWKWLFQEKGETEDSNLTKYVQRLLEAIDITDVSSSLQQMCDTFINNFTIQERLWKYYFIKYPRLIQICGRQNKYFFRYFGCLNILLLETSRLSGANREYYTAALQCYLEEKYGVEVYYPAQIGYGVKMIEKIGNKQVKIEFQAEGEEKGCFVIHCKGGNKQFREYQGDELVQFDDVEKYLLKEGFLTKASPT